jgi:dihydropteroate synthase
MGICNVTPDSFSDGGKYLSVSDGCAKVDELVAEGADIVDIGAESTRPRAPPVSAEEQLRRALPVVEYAAGKVCVSIDTASPAVAAACLDAGAAIVNDVSCLRDDELAGVAASHGAALILMHARGTQEQMPGFSEYPEDAYEDVVEDVVAEWTVATRRAMARGLTREALVMDPGLGYAKNARHSMELLRRVGELTRMVRAPVLVGASRKSFLQQVDSEAAPVERLGASIAAALFAAQAGASIVRVHDVRATVQAIDMGRLLTAGPPSLAAGRP